MKKREGNVLVIGVIFIAIALVIFLFILAIFMSHINSTLYNIKLDMYSLNKTAVIAVNKNKTNVDNFSYNKNTLKNEFVSLLKSNYELDDDLKNNEKLISSISIEEYEVYEKNKKDNYTNQRLDNRVIHTVLKVKIKPIILKSLLEKMFIFEIHEDVNLNMMEVKNY